MKYPQLSHSLIFGKKDKKREVEEKERSPMKGAASVRKRMATARRDELRDLVLETLRRAQSQEVWLQNLQEKHIKAYTRGGQFAGVVSNGKKYRFRTLGITEVFKEVSDCWHQLAVRQDSLHEITLQKLWRQWREFGFAGELLAVLGRRKETRRRQNSLRSLLQRKRECLKNQHTL